MEVETPVVSNSYQDEVEQVPGNAAPHDEPPMFLQRPSSAKSQDVNHILAKVFRQLYQRDAISLDTVQNLHKSRGGTDAYHEKYVAALKQIEVERDRRMAEAAMLERHIMQAQARAMSADERELARISARSEGFPDIGLPPARAHFSSCIDHELLHKHNLITPDDYWVKPPAGAVAPKGPKDPVYVKETTVTKLRRSLVAKDSLKRLPQQSTIHLESECELEHDRFFHDKDKDMEDDEASAINDKDTEQEKRKTKLKRQNLWKQQLKADDRDEIRSGLARFNRKVEHLKNPRFQPLSALNTRTLINPPPPFVSPGSANRAVSASVLEEIQPLCKTGKFGQYCKSRLPNETTVFVAKPAVMTFSDYSVGQTYEMALELQNVTAVLRGLRVLPPKSPYFSVGLGQFPGEQGVVAAGMSCRFVVRFAPDSLGDFDDELVVITQAEKPMVVKLQGRRPPPVLHIPRVLDLGECLVGGLKVVQFEVRNTGGSGRFVIMKKEAWPAANFKTAASAGAVSMPPFEVRPSIFELRKNQKCLVEVLFMPNTVEKHQRDLVLVCDNCHVKGLSVVGYGQIANVELTALEDGLAEPEPQELCDLTAQYFVRFANLNPFTYLQRALTVTNVTQVDLPYSWLVVKPYIRVSAPGEETELAIPTERIQDIDAAFSVEPDQGVIKAGQTLSFNLTFAPPEVADYHNVLHMVLKGIPKPEPDLAKDPPAGNGEQKMKIKGPSCITYVFSTEGRKRKKSSKSVCFIDNDKIFEQNDCGGRETPVSGGRETPVSEEGEEEQVEVKQDVSSEVNVTEKTDSLSVCMSGRTNSKCQDPTVCKDTSLTITECLCKSFKAKKPVTEDVTAMEIEVKGKCEPLSCMVQPYAIHIPGLLSMETLVKRQFRMINNSITAILFQWEKVSTEELILEVEPPIGELMPQGDLELELNICGSAPGPFEHTLLCTVQHLDEPLKLHVQGEVKGCELIIEQSNLNFGLVQLGESVETYMTLRNNERIAAQWAIKQAALNSDASQEEFFFEPRDGNLKSLDTQEVRVIFTPKTCRSINTVFDVIVRSGNSLVQWKRAIGVVGEVQSPQACLLSNTVAFEKVYKGVMETRTVELFNQTLLPAKYTWKTPVGKDASRCEVSMERTTGILKGRQTLPFTVKFTALEEGKYSDIRIPCEVDGMEQVLYFEITATSHGLSVNYEILGEDKETVQCAAPDLCFDFGTVELGSIPKQYLKITNLTAIPTSYSVSILYFKTKPPSPPPGKILDAFSRSQRLGINKSRATEPLVIDDPYGKSPKQRLQEMSRIILRDKKGAAFVITPEIGNLGAFEDVYVELAGYNDVWGMYSDTVYCQVGYLEKLEIPLSMDVVGNPLKFQMTVNEPDKEPFVRFGTHVSGSPMICRQARVNNSCPYDLQVDLEALVEHQTSRQPLDLVASFGRRLPPKDKDGNTLPTSPSAFKSLPIELNENPQSASSKPSAMFPENENKTDDFIREESALTLVTEDQSTSRTVRLPEKPKIVLVNLRPHVGIKQKCPFEMAPNQIMIPAKGSAMINVCFTPYPVADVTDDTECNGIVLAYASLPEERTEVPGFVSRKHGYDLQPLKLRLTAQVKPAFVRMECSEEEGMMYRAAASDLMNQGQMLGEVFKVCGAVIINPTLSLLHFKILTPAPFYIVNQPYKGHGSETSKPAVHLNESELITLQPRQSVHVSVGFRISLDLLDYLESLEHETTERPSSSKTPDVELIRKDGQRKLEFKGNLFVQFDNNTKQPLPLLAQLVVPSIHVSEKVIDFGTCLVGQQRVKQFMLKNTTNSDSYWLATIASKSDNCMDTTFELSPSSGMLEAQTSFIAQSSTLLTLYFTANHSGEYMVEFVFRGMLGEEPQHLVVKGHGSYDEIHEAIVNV